MLMFLYLKRLSHPHESSSKKEGVNSDVCFCRFDYDLALELSEDRLLGRFGMGPRTEYFRPFIIYVQQNSVPNRSIV